MRMKASTLFAPFSLAFAVLVALVSCVADGPLPAVERVGGERAAALQRGCGCTLPASSSPDYLAPALRPLALTGANSPSGRFRVEISSAGPGGRVLNVIRNDPPSQTVYESPPVSQSGEFGFSPDDDRFVFTSTAGANLSIALVDLNPVDPPGARVVWEQTNVVTTNRTFGFGPLGARLLFAYEPADAPSTTQLVVVNAGGAATGEAAFATSFSAALPAALAGRWGFSPDDETLVYAFPQTPGAGAPLAWNLINLVEGRNVLSFEGAAALPVASDWSFSPCADMVGIARLVPESGNLLFQEANLYSTVDGVEKVRHSPTPPRPTTLGNLPFFRAESSEHQLHFRDGLPPTKVSLPLGNPVAGTCPNVPLPSSVELDQDTLKAGSRTGGTVFLTAKAPDDADVIVALSSSDRKVAKVEEATVTVPRGTDFARFNVQTFLVNEAARKVDIRARILTFQKSARLTVQRLPSRPIESVAVSPASVVAGESLVVTLKATGSQGATAVNLASADLPPEAGLPTSVVIPDGATSYSFALRAPDVSALTTFTVRATTLGSSAGDVTRSGAFSVTLPGGPSDAISQEAGCTQFSMPRSDDGSSPKLALPFAAPLNYFGKLYKDIYINNNGNITFDQPLSSFTPSVITQNSRPIIAPFFADVDTTGAGSKAVTFGKILFDGRDAFCVNWVDVGYYFKKSDRLNRVQLLLVDRSSLAAPGDFDIVMNYGSVVWEAGDASFGPGQTPPSGGLGGISAVAGYSAGTGQPNEFAQIAGSLTNGAFLNSNPAGLAQTRVNSFEHRGRRVFRVRNGVAPVGGGTIKGLVTAGTNAAPLAEAPVQICRQGDSVCGFVTLTNADGSFEATELLPGSYKVTAFPPATFLLTPATSPVDLDVGDVETTTLHLAGLLPPPPEADIEPARKDAGGVPVVHRDDRLTLTTTGCPGANAKFEIRQQAVVLKSGDLSEDTPGHYTARNLVLSPNHGEATVEITITGCQPGPDAPPVSFSIYIDPSGTVRDTRGEAVPGALVTLLRSPEPTGPFVPVPDGSAVMAPTNRRNPDRSSATGRYGWDVLAGYYVVRVQKEGCLALDGGAFAESAVLTIPPPVFDLDFVLDCPEADTLPPSTTATLSTPADDQGAHHGPVEIAFAVSDNLGVDDVVGIFYELAGPSAGTGFVGGAGTTLVVDAEGETRVSYWAVDASGNVEPRQTLTVRIAPSVPAGPTIACAAEPSQLSPPNHKLVDVHVSVQTTGAVSFRLVEASSDEVDLGCDKGDVSGDIRKFTIGTPDVDGRLRAERTLEGDGREYSLVYEAIDAAGQTARCSAVVKVPR
jgi:hypothetical protein